MSTTATAPICAVIGGGVLGASTAQQLARAGADVVLITDGRLASGASGRSLSWLNSAGVRSEHYHRVRMAGIDRYRTLAHANPAAGWLRFDGGLRWQSAERAGDLAELHRFEQAHGYDSRLLSAREAAAQAAGVEAHAIPASGAIWNAGEGWVDLPSLVDYLVRDMARLGGRLITGAGPARVHLANRAVAAVTTAAGDRFAVDSVLLATGAAVPAMVAEYGVSIPDATPLVLLVRTAPVSSDLRAVLNSPRVAVRPAPGGALVVDSDWTAADITTAADGTFSVPAETVTALLAEASRVLDGHPALTAESCWIGPKPIPGDGEPVLGRISGVPGLSVAFTHSGATLGLIAGELLAYEMVTQQPHPLLAPFNVARFG